MKNNNIQIAAEAKHFTKKYGIFDIFVAQNMSSRDEHIVLSRGLIEKSQDLPCRITSECLTGTALNSSDCDCSEQIDIALNYINQKNYGIFIYLRQEGRGHGIIKKVLAMANKNKGFDTFKSIEMLGEKADIRDYSDAVNILKLYNIKSVELITNNPEKIAAIKASNIAVEKIIPILPKPTQRTFQHLLAKKNRGHNIHLECNEYAFNE